MVIIMSIAKEIKVVKRDGEIVTYSSNKIRKAIAKAIIASHQGLTYNDINMDILSDIVSKINTDCVKWYENNCSNNVGIGVEQIQDFVERELIKSGYADTAKEYILYRNKRNEIRKTKDSIAKNIDELLNKDSKDSDLKRDNGNVNGDAAMGTMLQIGSNVSKSYYLSNTTNRTASKLHTEGYIHIHDLDFYALTVTCCQIDCLKLFKGGFSTGHGYLREPNSIGTYGALAAIAIQSDQNDCHGGQSIPNFDYSMAPGVKKSFLKNIKNNINRIKKFVDIDNLPSEEKDFIETVTTFTYQDNEEEIDKLLERGCKYCSEDCEVKDSFMNKIIKMSYEEVDKQTYQAMEAVVHNLNSMHSRAGAQVPFSSLNLGTDTSISGRMVIKNLLLAMEAGLGHGETPIFPIVVFKVKEGVNYNPEDPNYDLFKLSMRVSAKRLFPNYCFIDAPFNLQYYKEGHPETEVATMGCRTRVMGNVYDKTREISYSRGNLSFTSINLPRLAIEANHDEREFFRSLDFILDQVKAQLLERFEIQAKRKVYNFPFLMGQGVWLDSDKLDWNDDVGEVLKHGTFGVGFIGLAECLTALYGHHHGEGKEYWDKGYAIIKYIRDYTDRISKETGLNFGCFGTPKHTWALV